MKIRTVIPIAIVAAATGAVLPHVVSSQVEYRFRGKVSPAAEQMVKAWIEKAKAGPSSQDTDYLEFWVELIKVGDGTLGDSDLRAEMERARRRWEKVPSTFWENGRMFAEDVWTEITPSWAETVGPNTQSQSST